MTMPRPKAVLFDLDGTLIDTAPEFIEIGHTLRTEAGLPPISSDIIRHSVSQGAAGMVQSAMEIGVDDPELEHWRGRFLALYEEKLGHRSTPYPGLPDLVGVLGKAGIPWGVVTNKLARFALPLMDKMGFVPAAGAIVTPDHVTHAKPHPEAITLACHQLNCDPSVTLFVGDHLRDIEAGKAAGCRTIAAAYGYLAHGESAQAWHADAVVKSSEELAELIEGTIS